MKWFNGLANARGELMLIRSGDLVEVITGSDRGTSANPMRGRVISINRETGKALIEGVSRVYKHVRRDQKHPQGGRLSKEMPVQLSNLMYVCQACHQATRLGARFQTDGSKERYCKKCGTAAGLIAPPKKAHATK